MNSHLASKTIQLLELQRRCRDRGIPLTWQRRAIYEALLDRRGHPTADELYQELRSRIPGLSRMTVYRVLDTLVLLGLADRALHPGSAGRFDSVTGPHHHLLCEACGRLVDLDTDSVPAVAPPAHLPEDFEIHAASVYFRGRCGECRVASGAAAPATPVSRTPSGRRTRS